MPYDMYLTGVKASLNTSPSGTPLTGQIAQSGINILTSGLRIDINHYTTRTSAFVPSILTPYLTGEQEIRMDILAVGSGAKGYKVTLLGYQII
jgi:hypothetical protein